MNKRFADRLYDAVKAKQTALVVGLDPVYSRLPAAIRDHRQMNDENDAAAAVDAIFEFSTQLMKVVCPLVAAVKINIAFFEKYLSEGIDAYHALLAEAQTLGLITIADIKRGDVEHAAREYADAHLADCQLVGLEDTAVADAVTINGMAGENGIRPFVQTANRYGRGVFVWVRSSNPSAAAIQDIICQDGQRWYQQLARIVGTIASADGQIGQSGYSNIGMVVGATSPQEATSLRDQYPHVWFLVPGLGTQGGSLAECVRFIKSDGTGALVTASRSIIYAYENPQYKQRFGHDWKKAVEQAVQDTKAGLARAIESGR